MELLKDTNAIWDNEKQEVFNNVEEGVFTFEGVQIGNSLRNEWWKLINESNDIVGYGWINRQECDFEISFVVKNEYSGQGYASQIITGLENIAIDEGYQSITAIVKFTNPNAIKIIEFLYNKDYMYYLPDPFGNMEVKKIDEAKKVLGYMDVTLNKNLII